MVSLADSDISECPNSEVPQAGSLSELSEEMSTIMNDWILPYTCGTLISGDEI